MKVETHGRVAKWFEVAGLPVARYLVARCGGVTVWSPQIEESAVLPADLARVVAREVRGVALRIEPEPEPALFRGRKMAPAEVYAATAARMGEHDA